VGTTGAQLQRFELDEFSSTRHQDRLKSGFGPRMPTRRSFASSNSSISPTSCMSLSGSCSTAAFAQSSVHRSLCSLIG